MIERLPIGSLVGICLIVLVVGIVIGRSPRAMSKWGKLHASAHGGAAKATATGGNADQRVQTVVVVDPHGVAKGADGRYDLDALERLADEQRRREVGSSQSAAQLGAGDEVVIDLAAEGLPVVRNAGRVAK